MRTYLVAAVVLVAACTDPADPEALAAADDELVVEMDGVGELAVIDNDVGVDDARTLELVAAPAHGTAMLDDTGVLHYAPSAEFIGADEVRYTVTNPDGSTSTAVVAIDVRCATCALGAIVTLAWDPNAPGDMVLGYRLYLGPTEDPATLTRVDDVAIDRPGFDPAMPTTSYDAWRDLRLRIGETACFRLTAYNAAGESGFSNPACKLVDGTSMRMGL